MLELGFNPGFSGSKLPVLSSKLRLRGCGAKKLAEVKAAEVLAPDVRVKRESRFAAQWTRHARASLVLGQACPQGGDSLRRVFRKLFTVKATGKRWPGAGAGGDSRNMERNTLHI